MARVEGYYNRVVDHEWQRESRHRTEFAVTLQALQAYLPPPPAEILDVGGGPGRYAIALAGLGYRVTLVDLAAKNLARARQEAAAAGVTLVATRQGDARELASVGAGQFAALLLLGPLYHLQEDSDRRKAVAEALRVLQPGGLLFAAFITRFAQVRYAARFDPEWLARDAAYFRQLLQNGRHNFSNTGLFTDAYFAHPEEITPFMEACGCRTQLLLGVEGAVAGLEDQVNALDGAAWDAWVALNYRLGQEPTLWGAADHLLYIGRRAEI